MGSRGFVYTLVGVAVSVLLSAGGASASQIIFLGSGSQRTDGNLVVGTTLNAASSFTIKSVGFIDVGNDGIANSYTVGVWDSSQNLLTSGVVTPASPLVSDFRWTNVSPVTLPAGTFTVGVALPSAVVDPWLDNASLALGFGFTGAGQGSFLNSNSLAFPSTADTGNNYIAANAADFTVPEPAILGVLLMPLALLFARPTRRGRSLATAN